MSRWWLGALVLVFAGCRAGVVCGPETRVSDGKCVPASVLTCGAGTHAAGGACVADVQCGAGTVASGGSCVAQTNLRCGPGTRLESGVCVVEDPMRRVTVPEAPEPNAPPGKAARFTVPGIGAAPVVLGGTIGPATSDGADFDGFIFSAKKLTRLHLAALAVGTPSVGFTLQPCKSTGTDACALDSDKNFARFALTIDSRSASRDVVIPSDGDWLLLVTDESNLTQGLPFGADGFTYTVDVTQVTPPPAVPLEAGLAATGHFDELVPHALTVTADQPLFDLALAPPDDGAQVSGLRALWALNPDGSLAFSDADTVPYGSYVVPMAPHRVAFPPGDALVFADFVYAIGPTPPYTLTATPVETTAMGALASPFSWRASLAGDGVDVYSVDVPGGVLLDVQMVPAQGTEIVPQIEIRDDHYRLVATADSFHLARYFAPAEAGRFYVTANDRTFDASKVSLGYTMKASFAPVTAVGPVAAGTEVHATAAIPDSGVAWFAVYAANDEDLGASVHPPASADVTLDLFAAVATDPLQTANAGGPGSDETVAPRLTASGSLLLCRVTGPAQAVLDFAGKASTTQAVFEVEPNDKASQATPLPLSASLHAEAAGTLRDANDEDYYAVTLTQPATLTATTQPGMNGDVPDTLIEILNASGGYVALNDDANGGPLSSVQVPVGPGTYYIDVRTSWIVSNAPSAEYILTVDGR